MTLTTLKTAREAILDLLIANLTDPEGRGIDDWIEGSASDLPESFVGWPVVRVMHNSQETPLKSFGTGTGSRRTAIGGVVIMVFTTGSIALQELIDSIIAVIYANESSLNSSGLNNVSVSVGQGDTITDAGDTLHSCPITVEYNV